MSFIDLAPELHLAIFSKLDYQSLVRISGTNKYLSKFLHENKNILRHALLRVERRAPRRPIRFRGRTALYPCYECCRGLSLEHFLREDAGLRRIWPLHHSEHSQITRACLTCSMPDLLGGPTLKFRAAHWSHDPHDPKGQSCIYCAQCRTVRTMPEHYDNWDRSYCTWFSTNPMCYPCWLGLDSNDRDELECRFTRWPETRRAEQLTIRN